MTAAAEAPGGAGVPEPVVHLSNDATRDVR